ncbi:MAG: hypothetical protein EBR67_11285, partial [Proteobacteria bacterium]|nr:hypothetical protein [Pseudomonadota bacterium]
KQAAQIYHGLREEISFEKGKLSGPSLPLADSYEYSNWRADFGLSEDWQKVNRKDKTDGLSQKAVDAYRRENPGSKLQTAVTEKKPKGKRAKRRANFCRRMKGMKSKLTSAKTARDLIVKAQTDAANAISLQEVLTAKAAAVSAATDVDKFLASVTTAQAAALEKINSFITFYQKVLAEYPQKLLESQQKALEAQLKAIIDAIQKYLDYALLQKPVSDKDPQLQQRVSDNLITLGDNITTTSKYLQSLIDTNAPQELIDWVTSIKDSMSADKAKADDFYSRALAEIKLLEKGKTDLAATLVAAKSATTIEQANALKLQAETQKAAVEAAASNAYQLLTAADAYSQKGIKTFNDALAELPNKLKSTKKVQDDIVGGIGVGVGGVGGGGITKT